MVRLARKKVDPTTVRGAQLKKETLFRIARLRMFQLAIRWILLLPWRQRNLRQMKLGLDKNLFKSKIPSGFEIDKPSWVVDEEAKDKNAEFWMYRFTAEENKTGKLIFCVLPKVLVDPLEEYLKCRETLLQGQASDTLFVNAYGRPMNAVTFGHMMCEISLRYGGDGKKRRGKRMNPHIFRDVFAFAYLKENPRDFVQLSIQLWHSSIDTTMKHYAGKFNASCGTQAVEAFAKARGVK
jgi:integrase